MVPYEYDFDGLSKLPEVLDNLEVGVAKFNGDQYEVSLFRKKRTPVPLVIPLTFTLPYILIQMTNLLFTPHLIRTK